MTCTSEAVFQEQAGHPIAHIAIPAVENTTAIDAVASAKGARHPQTAQACIEFMRFEPALAIFERYGFKRYQTPPH